MNGTQIRLNKLFSKGQNAVVIAIDHGYMDGPIPGMENLPETVKKIDPCIDAVLLSPGMLKIVGDAFAYKGAPIPIVRLNWSTVFCFNWGYKESRTVPAFRVKDAIALGAEVVLVSLTLKTGDERNDARNVEIFSQLSNEAREYGIPVVGECFPNDSDNIGPEEMHDIVLRGTRILAELGADLIKTFRTARFSDVVAGCSVPVLGWRAAMRLRIPEFIEDGQGHNRRGGRGVVFGRNAIQRARSGALTSACCQTRCRPIEAVERYGQSES